MRQTPHREGDHCVDYEMEKKEAGFPFLLVQNSSRRHFDVLNSFSSP
jgi:hypothetical protein